MKAKSLLFILMVATGSSWAAANSAETIVWSDRYGDYVSVAFEDTGASSALAWSDTHGDYVPTSLTQSAAEDLHWSNRHGDYVPSDLVSAYDCAPTGLASDGAQVAL